MNSSSASNWIHHVYKRHCLFSHSSSIKISDETWKAEFAERHSPLVYRKLSTTHPKQHIAEILISTIKCREKQRDWIEHSLITTKTNSWLKKKAAEMKTPSHLRRWRKYRSKDSRRRRWLGLVGPKEFRSERRRRRRRRTKLLLSFHYHPWTPVSRSSGSTLQTKWDFLWEDN